MTLLILVALYAVVLSAALAWAGHWSRPAARSEAPPRRPLRILIVGATGGTGRMLVAQSLERGYAVTAFVRDPSRLKIEHPRLRIVPGDVLDAESVAAAVYGQQAVLSALGHKQYFKPTRIQSQGTANILRAMDTHGVSRFVCETSLGIGDSAGRMGLYYTFFVVPFILPFYYWDKTRQERIIGASGADWVIVRPGALNNGARRGQYRHGRHVGNYFWTVRISRADVAAFMLDQLESDSYLRSAPGVCWSWRWRSRRRG
ncbi:MAG TPA: SDR family oxidoreductase [Gammaproteobacteria bacterium]|nr:SDR family oxidoreductase [Gammaproteobacteria bacterium]